MKTKKKMKMAYFVPRHGVYWRTHLIDLLTYFV